MNGEPDAIDGVLQLIDRPVWIITAAAGRRRGGLLATWVSAASIDPQTPSLLIALAANHYTAQLVDEAGGFAAHLITGQHLPAAWNFALDSGRQRDKLAGWEHQLGVGGSPVLTDCLAWLECRVFARLLAGDRNYYWADVVEGGRRGSGQPLTEQQLMAAADPDRRALLCRRRDEDIAVQRPVMAQWKRGLPASLRPPSGGGR